MSVSVTDFSPTKAFRPETDLFHWKFSVVEISVHPYPLHLDVHQNMEEDPLLLLFKSCAILVEGHALMMNLQMFAF